MPGSGGSGGAGGGGGGGGGGRSCGPAPGSGIDIASPASTSPAPLNFAENSSPASIGGATPQTTVAAPATDSGSVTTTRLAAGSDTVTAEATTAPQQTQSSCSFDQWTQAEYGGSDTRHGTVDILDDTAVMSEGDSFLVTFSHTMEIPEGATDISFTYDPPSFDTAANFINDAFEVALIDSEGRSLVHTIGEGRDSYFNITEDKQPAVGHGTTIEGQTVTTDISGLFPGTSATMVFRLVDNDSDTGTTVRITGVQCPGTPSDDLPPTTTIGLEHDTAPTGPDVGPYETDKLTNDSTVVGIATDDRGISLLEARVDSGPFTDITSALYDDTYRFAPGVLPPGAHQITVRAIDTTGQPAEAVLDFTVNTPPTADAGGPYEVSEGTLVEFDGTMSADTEDPIYGYEWTFHDGRIVTDDSTSNTYPEERTLPCHSLGYRYCRQRRGRHGASDGTESPARSD